MMSRAMVYRWYEALEKGRASASLKGGPGASCRAVMEVIVNTVATPPFHEAGPLWRSRARGCGVSGTNLACVHRHMPHQTSINQQEPTLMLKQLVGILDISKGSVHTILPKKLYILHVSAKWVPQLLMNKMMVECECICAYWRDRSAEDETWFVDVITIDESWMYCYDPTTKQSTGQ